MLRVVVIVRGVFVRRVELIVEQPRTVFEVQVAFLEARKFRPQQSQRRQGLVRRQGQTIFQSNFDIRQFVSMREEASHELINVVRVKGCVRECEMGNMGERAIFAALSLGQEFDQGGHVVAGQSFQVEALQRGSGRRYYVWYGE